MKRLLVSCDHYVFLYNKNFYIKESGLILLNRYLNVFDSIKLAVRVRKVDNKNNLGIHNYLIKDPRIKIHAIPFFQGPVQFLSNYLLIKKSLKGIENDVNAAIFRLPSPTAFLILPRVKQKNIPFAIEIIANSFEKVSIARTSFHRIIFLLTHKKLKNAVNYARGVSYVTNQVLQQIYSPKNTTVFTANYSSVELKENFFHERKIKEKHSNFTICHVTNQIKTHSKGHVVLINVLKQIMDKGYSNIYLKFAGYGPLVEELIDICNKLGIGDHVAFIGYLSLDELRQFLINSDIMVFPSKTEGMPRCLIEAMSTGLPCLSTPVGGTPELLPQELLFSFDDTDGFANKIIELYEDIDKYNELSSELFKISKMFESNLLTARRNAFYQQLYSISI